MALVEIRFEFEKAESVVTIGSLQEVVSKDGRQRLPVLVSCFENVSETGNTKETVSLRLILLGFKRQPLASGIFVPLFKLLPPASSISDSVVRVSVRAMSLSLRPPTSLVSVQDSPTASLFKASFLTSRLVPLLCSRSNFGVWTFFNSNSSLVVREGYNHRNATAIQGKREAR
ncbi:hypothetical protein RJT34_17246 [Clitoria ternatea]|uniref:Uncharacterized protein n=1 Tax=Clitoria ternatea TaxID=43366 RepID=A0AAN9J8L5_CLITE